MKLNNTPLETKDKLNAAHPRLNVLTRRRTPGLSRRLHGLRMDGGRWANPF